MKNSGNQRQFWVTFGNLKIKECPICRGLSVKVTGLPGYPEKHTYIYAKKNI